MPRLPVPDDSDDFPSATREAVRHAAAIRGNPGRPTASGFLMYAGSPGVMLFDLVDHLWRHSSLTGAEMELAICTSARASGNDYIWDAHVRLALAAGAREEAIRVIDEYLALEELTADEALIVGFGRELLKAERVTDETFEAVRMRYGERGLLELVGAMSVYVMNASILRAMDVQPLPDSRLLTR
jgi:4-carboxymuconolactone decarboxylase